MVRNRTKSKVLLNKETLLNRSTTQSRTLHLTGESIEEPEYNSRSGITLESHLLHEAPQIIQTLSRHVVEVHQMSHGVQDGEEERSAGHDLVELDVGVYRDVLVDRVVLHERQDVAGHCQQEQGVAEGQGGGRPSCDGDPDPHHVAQVGVFRQETVVCGEGRRNGALATECFTGRQGRGYWVHTVYFK